MHDTALIGLGRIASKYSSDKAMLKSLNFFTHAQVLDKHQNYNWISGVDPSEKARHDAEKSWGARELVSSVRKLKNRESYTKGILEFKDHEEKLDEIFANGINPHTKNLKEKIKQNI